MESIINAFIKNIEAFDEKEVMAMLKKKLKENKGEYVLMEGKKRLKIPKERAERKEVEEPVVIEEEPIKVEPVVKATHIVLTPINTVDNLGKSKAREMTRRAREDYYREKKESEDFKKPSAWDDSYQNTGKIGDLFGFVDYKADRIEIFRVTGIKEARLRREEWDMENHKTRQVLVLSKKIKETSWSTYRLNELSKFQGVRGVVQGTTRTDLK